MEMVGGGRFALHRCVMNSMPSAQRITNGEMHRLADSSKHLLGCFGNHFDGLKTFLDEFVEDETIRGQFLRRCAAAVRWSLRKGELSGERIQFRHWFGFLLDESEEIIGLAVRRILADSGRRHLVHQWRRGMRGRIERKSESSMWRDRIEWFSSGLSMFTGNDH